ncbi:hypothetical protein [Bradyrhizobium ottawaense]|uniref:hypothetical protein n=1 Tax=Bradyrhizobium ottawaense TaxID=931866 RepID=UPI0030F39DFA
MLVHGVSLSLRFWQARHPPRYAAYLIPSSPSFPHSSIIRLQAGIAKGDSLKIVCCQYVRLWINNHAPMTMKLLHDGADDLVKLQKAEAP